MAKNNNVCMEFTGFADLLKRFEDAEADMEKTVEQTLVETQKEIAKNTKKLMRKSNLPAKGKYSTGETSNRIIKDGEVTKNGALFSISTGFDMEKDGKLSITSAFLIYGTPKFKPVSGLKNAIMGNKVNKKYRELLQKNMDEALEKKFGG